MREAKLPTLSRRHVFAGAGTVGALAVAAAALPLAGQPQPDKVAATPRAAPDKGGGYQLTEHVLRYYQTTRV